MRWTTLALLWLGHVPTVVADSLRLGWVERPPYANETRMGQGTVVSGLDIELLREAAIGVGRTTTETRFADEGVLIEAVRANRVDVAVGFDVPETQDVLGTVLRREQDALWQRDGQLADEQRLCVVKGERIADARLAKWIGAHASQVSHEASEAACVSAFIHGRVEGIIGDNLAIATAALHEGIGEVLRPVAGEAVQDGLLLWAPQARRSGLADDIEAELDAMRASGRFDEVAQRYLFPVIVSITTASAWYSWIDILGTVAFIISGLIIARRENYNVVGAAVLGLLPAVGGGIVRDLLCGRHPVAFVRSDVYLPLILAVVAIGWLVANIGVLRGKGDGDVELTRRGERFVEFWDAVGLASFTVTGVAVALSQGLKPLWLWGPLFAALTASGGGVIRDVVRSKPAGTLTTSFYAEVAILWGLALSVWLTLHGVELTAGHFSIAAIVTLVGAVATRMVVWYTGFGPIRF